MADHQPLEKRQKLDENVASRGKDGPSDLEETRDSLSTQRIAGHHTKCLSASTNIEKHRSESDVGISQYCSQNKGFSGILKQRYSDFLVNEINLDRRTVHLTNTELPQEFLKEELDCAVLPPEILQKLQDMVNDGDKSSKIVVATEDDKEQRTQIHREIRLKFPMLESDTAEVDNHKVVRAFYSDKSQARRRKNDWPKERGEFCHFVMYKENKDTMQAISILAKCLKIKPDRFAFAGTKDGRAITVQCVSVFRVDARNLQGLNKVLNNIHVGNFEFKKTPLKLGDLKGNRFVVVLRDVDANESLIKTSMSSLNILGFINYYGLQRFGSSKNATQAIGLCLLQCKWLEAIDLILGSRCEQDDVLCKAYEHWIKTGNAKESLHMLQGKKCLETFLLEGLAKFGNDLVSAIKVLPRNTRLMYVHAYQSYIWNVVVSKRIQELGLKVVIGDLVFNETKSTSVIDENISSEPVKFVTSEDINLYTIHDVIMPLPGYDVTYPEHTIKACYEKLLSQDNLDIKNMRHKVKDYSLSGTYRHIVVKPESLKWEIASYDDPTVSLVEADYDLMMGASKPVVPCSDGKYKALKMEFTLPSSSYATMLVREILKSDTSPSYHSSLNRH